MKLAPILFLALLAPTLASAQTPVRAPDEVTAVFNSFRTSLGTLQSRYPKKPAHLVEKLGRIKDYADFLEVELTSNKPLPRMFLEGVASDARLLERLAGQPAKTKQQQQRLYEGLGDVESDLQVKISGPRNGGEVARVVRVAVRAKKGDQDVAAYEVWFVPKGWAKHSSEFRRFDGLTNPANPPSMLLAPGTYHIWLSKDQIPTLGVDVSIGKYSEDKRELDMPVP